MSLKSFILFCFLASIWVSAFAQTLPAGLKVPSSGGALPKGIPTNGLEALATKAEIPYLEELRQVQGLKKSYDSLRSEVKKLKEAAQDSTTQAPPRGMIRSVLIALLFVSPLLAWLQTEASSERQR